MKTNAHTWKSWGWRCWLLKVHSPKVDSFWAKDKSPSFLWPRAPLSQHLLFQQKVLPLCMRVCVCLHSRITVSQCVQLCVVVFIWRRNSEAGSVLGPLTSDPNATAVLSLKQKSSNMCTSTYNCVIDLLPAGTHAEWENARLNCRRATPRLLYLNHNLYTSRAEEEKREEFSSSPTLCEWKEGRNKKCNDVILQEN